MSAAGQPGRWHDGDAGGIEGMAASTRPARGGILKALPRKETC